MTQRLLQRNRGHIVQEREIVGFLPPRQQRGALRIVNPTLLLEPRRAARLQGLVVHQAHTAERARQLSRLLVRGVEAELQSPLHDILRHTRHDIENMCEKVDDMPNRKGLLPARKDGACAPER